MTHFVGLVVADNEEDLERLLAPFDESQPAAPYWVEVEDRDGAYNPFKSMCDHYKTTDLQKLVEHMEDWTGAVGEVRDDKLGYYSTYNQDAKWDWYVVGGRWDHVVPYNACLAEAVLGYFPDYTPAVIVDRKGWHCEKDYGWWGTSKDIPGHVDLVKQKLVEHKGKNVYVVDFHGA